MFGLSLARQRRGDFSGGQNWIFKLKNGVCFIVAFVGG